MLQQISAPLRGVGIVSMPLPGTGGIFGRGFPFEQGAAIQCYFQGWGGQCGCGQKLPLLQDIQPLLRQAGQ